MAKFTPGFNKEINRVVKSFNQKIRRAEARGVRGLPDIRSVKDLKAQFATEIDMKREIDSLRTLLNNKEALQRRRLREGTVSNWQYDYIVRNLEATKKFVDRDIERANERLKDYPDYLYAIRADLQTLESRKEALSRNISELSADELRTVSAIVNRYKRSNLRIRAGREFFMRNLDDLLSFRDVKLKDRREIARKLNELTNAQFEEFYRRHDIVTDVFTKMPSPPSEKNKKKGKEDFTDDETVDKIAEEFTENLDQYINEVKDIIKE